MVKNAARFTDLLRPPGGGLLTVSSGSAEAQKKLGQYLSPSQTKNWKKQVHKKLSIVDSPFFVIGFPSDAGAGIVRGSAHGPLALRAALYKKNSLYCRQDLGDIPCIPQLSHDNLLSAQQKKLCAQALWGMNPPKQAAVSPLNLLENLLKELWKKHGKSFRPLVLGGDHSLSGAVFRALHASRLSKKLAVLHIDAHTDLLEDRFGIEHCFATWTAHSLPLIDNPKNWIQVGLRASAKKKSYWEKKFALKQYWANEVRKMDPKLWAQKIIRQWKKNGCTHLYISNDIDGTDSLEAPSTGTAEPLGLSSRWVATAIKECCQALPLVGADLVEVAPVLGSPKDGKKTVSCATKQIEALHWTLSR